MKLRAIPKGWVSTEIGQICQLVGGGTPSRKNPQFFGGKIPWFTPTEVSKIALEKVSKSKEMITELGLQKSSAKLVPKNAVLLTTRASIGYVAIADSQVTTNQGFASFICSESIDNHFLAYWLWKNRNLLIASAKGTTFKEISKSTINKLQIDLPPIHEQKRIVSRIQSLFIHTDTAKQSLETALSSLEQYRLSVLYHAFKDRLVQCGSNEQPLHLQYINRCLGQIIQPSKERFDPTTNKNTTFIGLEHIESNTGRILKQGKSKSMESTKTVFHSGDILYGRLRPYLNKVCVPDFNGVCSTDILVFPKSQSVSNKYIALFLLTPNFVAYANKNATGIQHPRISFKKIEEYQIPLPPLSAQKHIVTRVESLFSKINATKQSLEATLSLLEQHRQSVLNYAFEGRFVQQQRKARR